MFLCTLVLSGCAGIQPDTLPTREAQPNPVTAEQRSVRSSEMVFQALATAGVPYQHGGDAYASGFDCSGLVAYVYREALGIRLPHNAKAQSKAGEPISISELLPGDLVFYNTEAPFSHVGIYLGDKRFVHAPKSGAAMRIENMRAAYWVKRFDGARRIPTSAVASKIADPVSMP